MDRIEDSSFDRQHSTFNSVLVVSSNPNMDRIEDRLLMTESIWLSAFHF